MLLICGHILRKQASRVLQTGEPLLPGPWVSFVKEEENTKWTPCGMTALSVRSKYSSSVSLSPMRNAQGIGFPVHLDLGQSVEGNLGPWDVKGRVGQTDQTSSFWSVLSLLQPGFPQGRTDQWP